MSDSTVQPCPLEPCCPSDSTSRAMTFLLCCTPALRRGMALSPSCWSGIVSLTEGPRISLTLREFVAATTFMSCFPFPVHTIQTTCNKFDSQSLQGVSSQILERKGYAGYTLLLLLRFQSLRGIL